MSTDSKARVGLGYFGSYGLVWPLFGFWHGGCVYPFSTTKRIVLLTEEEMVGMYMKCMLFMVIGMSVVHGLTAEELTFEGAQRRAAAQAFEVRKASFEERAREWEKRNAIAGYMPSVSYGVDYTAMDPDIVSASNSSFDAIFELLGSQFTDTGASRAPSEQNMENVSGVYEHTLSHSITVTQPITNGGAEIFGIRAGNHAKRAVELQLESARQQALYSTREAYFRAILASEAVELSRENLSWARLNLEKSRTREQGGMVPRTDVLQWEAEVAGMEGELATAVSGQNAAILALYQSMGISADQADTSVALEPMEVFQRHYAQTTDLPQSSPDDNIHVKVLKELSELHVELRRMAGGRFFPSINAFGSYSWPFFWSPGENQFKAQSERTGWTAGVTASLPLFTGGRNSSNYQKTRFEAKVAEVNYEQVRSGTAVNLGRLSSAYPASRTAVEAARKKRDLMEQQRSIMQQRYDGGLVNQTQLLDVARGAHAAKLGYVQKLFNCLLLHAEYLVTAGVLEVSR